MLYISQGNSRDTFQWIKICEIGDPWYPDHRNINKIHFLFSVKSFCEAVLILHLNIQIRSHSHYRDMASLLQHLNTWIQDRLIAAEFVDDQTLYHLSFILFQKLHCTNQLCKNTTSVNISHQKHRCLCHLCHSHIYDIFCFQIDFRRASSPLNHNDIIFFCQLMKCLHNVRHQFFLIFKIVSGTHGSQDFSVYDHLGAYIIGRLQKNGVHQHRRLNSGCLRLHNLSSAHLQPLFCNKRVQCHILGFKGCHPVSILFKNPAKPCCQKAFSCIGHCPLHHNRFCHFLFPLFSCINTYESTSSSTSISFSFCSCSFTATR